jgi:hypothetical protein
MSGWAAILTAAHAERDTFARACEAPRAAQLALLRQILDDNAGTEFGRLHRFEQIDTVDGFRVAVPVRDYGALRGFINRAAGGERAVLTTAPVVAFEETGGSTSGRKLIPYTSAALAAFRAAVLPWLGDLADQHPGTFAGRAYVALSPVTRAPRATAGGISIGLPSEGAYLGADLAAAFASVLVVPPEVGQVRDIAQWRLLTLRWLVQAADLSFISVWSPTFLLGLIEKLPVLAEPLVKAVHDGTIASDVIPGRAEGASPESILRDRGYGFRTRPSGPSRNDRGNARNADPERARAIAKALACHSIDTQLLWPQLTTISAWADGASRPYAKRLQALFPHASVQPKGLLATEGAVTIPWQGSPHPVPAISSAFIEFIDDAGRAHLCDELRQGTDYRVVITTPSGLYRYDLGDRLRCHGYAGGLPRLEFVGRAGVATDIVGEKLAEDFVSEALGQLGGGACLAARATATPFYELLVDAPACTDLAPRAAAIEERLNANPQYAYARALGQLGPVRPRAVERLLERHAQVEARRGRRLADIKPPVLIGDDAYEALIGATGA